MDEKLARKYFEKFKKAKRTSLRRFCKRERISCKEFREAVRKYIGEDEWNKVIASKKSKRKYKRGRSFEYKVKKILEGHGYFVIRAAASKGSADLVAIKKGSILFVQCKKEGYMSYEEQKKLYELATNVGAMPVWAVMEDKIKFYEIKNPEKYSQSKYVELNLEGL